MLMSMTGFGEASFENGNLKIGFRVRSVNHRALDLNMRLPQELGYLEPALRKLIQDRVFRGRIDVFTEFSLFRDELMPPARLDVARLNQMLGIADQLLAHPLVNGPLDVNALIRVPDLIVTDRSGFRVPEQEETHIKNSLVEALDQLLESRQTEGTHLLNDIQARVTEVQPLVDRVEVAVLERRDQLIDQMRKRLDVLRGEVEFDESRLQQEVVFWADRLDISEEITRLQAHFAKLAVDLNDAPRPAGKKLEFTLQEILREVTTIANKAKLESVSELIVTIKTELEKIREQLANIE